VNARLCFYFSTLRASSQVVGAAMNKKPLKSKKDKISTKTHSKRNHSIASLRLQYKFWILIGVLILAGISIVLRLETPVVWTFLYGIGGWAALTTNPGGNLR
jgi:hypothetical protein